MNELNDTVNKVTWLKPSVAVKLKKVKLKFKKYDKETPLPTDGLYRHLYEPGEQHHDTRRRATDLIWSWDTFRLDRIIENPGQRVLYYLSGNKAPKGSFVSEQLMLIPESTEDPPSWVQTW